MINRHAKNADLLFEEGHLYNALEIKSGSTFSRDFTDNLSKWRTLSGTKSRSMTLVYGGSEKFEYKGIKVLHWFDTQWIK